MATTATMNSYRGETDRFCLQTAGGRRDWSQLRLVMGQSYINCSLRIRPKPEAPVEETAGLSIRIVYKIAQPVDLNLE